MAKEFHAHTMALVGFTMMTTVLHLIHYLSLNLKNDNNNLKIQIKHAKIYLERHLSTHFNILFDVI